MTSSTDRQFQIRAAVLSAIILGMMLVLVGRILYWQNLPRRAVPLDPKAPLMASRVNMAFQRGTIWDRHGHILAVEIPEYDIIADPQQVEDVLGEAQVLETLLGVPAAELASLLAQKERRYVPLKRGVAEQVGQDVRDASLPGIYVQYAPRRYYPMHESGAHVLGFLNAERRAYYGLEEWYDAELRGSSGSWGELAVVDPHRFVPPRNGASLVLTLDWTVQTLAERALHRAVQQDNADGGTVIVVDPKTGAVLAMANVPSYDPNEFAKTPVERFVNPAISALYEPGSVIKVITLAAALEEGIVTPETRYDDKGFVEVEGVRITNWDRVAHGYTSMVEMMQKSLNVGAVHVVMQVGPERFYRYLEAFGFGRPTNIDLAGEVGGVVHTPAWSKWSPLTLATNAFGQGMAATPIQVIMAIAAVANGGELMRPYVVDRILPPDGPPIKTQPQVVRRVLSEETARTLTQVLVQVIKGGVEEASVPGYALAGKTGTSQIPTEDGYDPEHAIASFVGYGPADDPRFVILVKIDRPRHRIMGSDVAAPVFQEIARGLLTYYGIAPDNVRLVQVQRAQARP